VLSETGVGTVTESLGESDLPVSAGRPLLDPGLVGVLVVERSDALDSLPLAFSGGDAQPVLNTGCREEAVEQANTGGSCRRAAVGMRREVMRLVQQAAFGVSMVLLILNRCDACWTHLSLSTSSLIFSSLALTNTQISSFPLPALPGLVATRRPSPSSARRSPSYPSRISSCAFKRSPFPDEMSYGMTKSTSKGLQECEPPDAELNIACFEVSRAGTGVPGAVGDAGG
jgi:hypothetical protein